MPSSDRQPTPMTMRERILAATAEVLTTLPLSKITMEDIARTTGVARQTIYKHFANRDDIITALCVAEVERTHWPRLVEMHAERIDPEQLTAMFIEQLRMAREWSLLDRTFDPSLAPRIAEQVLSSQELAECNRKIWEPILGDYAEAGYLRPELDPRQVIRWMTYQSCWFLSHPDALTTDNDDLHDYVRQMMVAAWLT